MNRSKTGIFTASGAVIFALGLFIYITDEGGGRPDQLIEVCANIAIIGAAIGYIVGYVVEVNEEEEKSRMMPPPR